MIKNNNNKINKPMQFKQDVVIGQSEIFEMQAS